MAKALTSDQIGEVLASLDHLDWPDVFALGYACLAKSVTKMRAEVGNRNVAAVMEAAESFVETIDELRRETGSE